jgi:hypothetical protein
MKAQTLFVAVLGLVLSSGLNAQNLYGWRAGLPGTGHRIFAMDPDTGATVHVADTGAYGNGYGVANVTFDPIGKRYFFDGESNLLMVNLATGVTTPVYANGIGLLEFDTLTGLLYGMKTVFPSGNLFVFSLNPETGATAQVADTGVTARAAGPPLFDPFRRRYIFPIYEPPGDKLLVIDLATGTRTRVPSLLGALVFDPATRLFYGTRFMPDSGTFGVFSWDLTSGVTTFVADTGLTNNSGGDPTFDPIGRRYFLTVTSYPTPTTQINNVVVVNLVTGVVKQLNDALYNNKFDAGSNAVPIPELNVSFLITLAIFLAFVGFWRTAR